MSFLDDRHNLLEDAGRKSREMDSEQESPEMKDPRTWNDNEEEGQRSSRSRANELIENKESGKDTSKETILRGLSQAGRSMY
jgi:hypothetical protein